MKCETKNCGKEATHKIDGKEFCYDCYNEIESMTNLLDIEDNENINT